MRPELLALACVFPAAGATFRDPETNAAIIRVTDEHMGNRCVHAYSTWSPLNADDTRLLIACDDVPLLFRVDGNHVTYDRPLAARVQFEGAIWSRTDPDLLYALDAHRGTRLVTVDVTTGKAHALHDFGSELPAGEAPFQLDASDDARVFTFHTRDADGHKLDAYVWSADTLRRFPRAPGEAVDETQLDPRGTRLLVTFTDGSRALWDLGGNPDEKITRFKMSGHYDLGDGFLVADDGVRNGVMLVDAAGVQHPLLHYDAWTVADHVALLRSPDAAIVSTYGSRDEIIRVPLDGGAPKTLAHTCSTRATTDYWAQPRAAVDYRGRYVVWTSDLGSPDRLDVLMMRL